MLPMGSIYAIFGKMKIIILAINRNAKIR
jgi:hypothetical protein